MKDRIERMEKPFRINVGEAMVEPFWDPSASGLEEWELAETGAKGAKVQQYWCYVPFEWLEPDEEGRGIVLRRCFEGGLTVKGYDRLVLSAAIPEKGFLRLEAETELGARQAESAGGGKKELQLALDGAEEIRRLAITVGSTVREPATGWLNWLGAQNDRLLEEHLALRSQYNEKWEGFLKDESYEPSFTPRYGLIATKEELERMRARYEKHLAEGGRDVFYDRAVNYLDKKPEDMIGDYVRLTDDVRFCRIRDENQYTADSAGEKLVQYALLKKDRKALRLAARYCLSLLMTGHWLDSFLADYPLGLWEHSGFVPSIVLSDMAAVLDGAGELFTDKAVKMIQKQMMEKGLSKVNSVVWRYDSIFHCNQLAWYSYGRMSAYAVLSREFPRLVPYMELAKKDMEDSMALAMGGDGAADEGVSYFLYQPAHSGGGLFWYARALGKSFRECLPAQLFTAGDYADVMSTTGEEGCFMPVCDYTEPRDVRGLAIMAYALPDSLWVNAYHKKCREQGGFPSDFIALALDGEIPAEDNRGKSFLRLGETGYVSSLREKDGIWTKIFAPGNKPGVGHNHEDKGSFIVEYNGEQIFTDPGMISYGDAGSRALKMCDFHNMLLPAGTAVRPHPRNPFDGFYAPEGVGDEERLHLKMELTAAFDGFYEKWERSLDSESPEELTVTDCYRLKEGRGVTALLQTWGKVEEKEGEVRITCEKACCTFRLPEGVSLEVKSHVFRGKELRTLCLYKAGEEGTLRIEMRFEPRA